MLPFNDTGDLMYVPVNVCFSMFIF